MGGLPPVLLLFPFLLRGSLSDEDEEVDSSEDTLVGPSRAGHSALKTVFFGAPWGCPAQYYPSGI